FGDFNKQPSNLSVPESQPAVLFCNIHSVPTAQIRWEQNTKPLPHNTRLDCKAEGVPKPKIYWLKNGKPLPNEARIKRQPTGLVFSHTFSSDSAIYQCFAVNAAGKTWAAAQLKQNTFHIPSPPENVQCRPFDETSICLTWRSPQNISVSAYSIYSFYTAMGLEISGPEFVTNETHQLATRLNGSTNYTFYVRLYSKIASDQSQEVTCKTGVTGKRNLRVKAINETSVELTWSNISSDVPCDDAKKEAYKVQWKPKGGRSSAKFELVEDFSCVISGLSNSVDYEFRVAPSWLKNDNSPWTIFTRRNGSKIGTEMIAPEQVEASPISSTSINLTWLDANDNTQYYLICIVDIKKQNNCDESDLIKSVSNSVQISSLQSETLYEFKVRAHSSEDCFSQYSQPAEVHTPADVPSKVLNLGYEIVNETTACLHWQTPMRKNGKLSNYLVSYTANDNWLLDKWLNKSVSTTQNKVKGCWTGNDRTFSTLLVDLKPEREYTVYVRAVSDGGFGNVIKLNTNKQKIVEPPELQDDIQYNQKLGINHTIGVVTLAHDLI
ncbi:receptor-type tyrosine-protein phosphatase F-like, partial [Asbolus verrucosus]